MSDYMRTFAISAGGMSLERLRLEVAATNLANANATQLAGGRPYLPLRVVAAPATGFESALNDRVGALALRGPGAVRVEQINAPPRLESDPGNPAADAQGMVARPSINPVEESLTLLSCVRAYEANVRAFNAGKAMAQKALQIGSSSL
jgi:flagellar basal-body rod protein FlgC